MGNSRYLVDQLRFPAPPARIDRTWRAAPFLPPVAIEYLAEIRRWRARLCEVLLGEASTIDGSDGLTPRAREHLTVLLSSEWDPATLKWAADSSYNIAPFPTLPTIGHQDDPMSSVMEVLQWRAAAADYLSDVWDVLGKPTLELPECRAMSRFLQPVRMEGRCVFCLTEFD